MRTHLPHAQPLAPTPHPADPDTRQLANRIAEVADELRLIRQSRFVRAPIMTIGWGLVMWTVLWIMIFIVGFGLLILTGAAGAGAAKILDDYQAQKRMQSTEGSEGSTEDGRGKKPSSP